MKNAFYFILKALFVLTIFIYNFCRYFFRHVGKRHDRKTKNISFKLYNVTTWEINNYNAHFAQHLKK